PAPCRPARQAWPPLPAVSDCARANHRNRSDPARPDGLAASSVISVGHGRITRTYLRLPVTPPSIGYAKDYCGFTMSLLSLLLNLLWIICGGVWMGLAWLIASVIMAITIIGIPWARAAFNIAIYTFLPFGYKAVSRAEHYGREDVGTGPLGIIGNLIWLVLA